MSTTKAALKAVGAAIQSSKYDEAVALSRKILATEPENYQANLFLGFAHDKQTKYLEAEEAYERATRSKPSDPQAWQGLIRLFEKQGNAKVTAYQRAVLNLAKIYMDLDDKYKCQDVVDKFTVFAKNQGTRQQHREALEILLPSSPIYDYLEGRIPHPGYTYQTIAQITETDEKERMNKEIGERRTRLGAKISQVTIDVRREIFRDSPLEDLYSNIIDWTSDDDVRRQYEEKLLQRCYDVLNVLPIEQKSGKRTKVQKLAIDMVIIKHPFKLAWDITLEWKDYILLKDWDSGVLKEYCFFFPESGLGKVLQGYLTSEVFEKHSAGVDSDADDDDQDGGVGLARPAIPVESEDTLGEELTPEDRLLLMMDGMAEATNSILAHRAMGEYYAFLDEYESVVEISRTGLKLVQEESKQTGLSFENSSQSLMALLGTALVFYQSPKNHPEAKALFDSILAQNNTSTAALIGIGLIYEEEEDYPSAIEFLERALRKNPQNFRIRAEAAWAKAVNGDFEGGRYELETCLSHMEVTDVRSRTLRAQTQYRIGMCIWNMDTSAKSRKDRTGAYAYFIAALKSDLNYAPAYTSLGIFYNDYSKDKKRARKCFQKAFELSPAEVEAAERLARAFSEQGEWELVEVVSQRVVNSGKVKPAPGSKKKGISWPFAALGVAELNKQDYSKSVVSFQSALRISPNDYHSWVGLGESYHNSGRYIAATKAFTHAEKFEQEVEQQKSGDTWFAKYMLANVKRELGEYAASIDGYRAVLKVRPNEFGVMMALIQTLVESAWDSVDKGLFGQAAQLAGEAIVSTEELSKSHEETFNLWKALGDACSVFTWIQDRISEFPHSVIKRVLEVNDRTEACSLFAEVDAVDIAIVFAEGLFPQDEQLGLDLSRCMQAAVICHKCAIHSASHDIHAQAVAYYNLGWTEYRAHVCLSATRKKKSTRYLKAAVHCFKRAIELEAGNSEFWNALGVVTSELAPKVAQHSFVRSLYLNERSAQAWTNLGTLYLVQNDTQLAHDAFTRAQSTDPEFAHAWVGQGLIALLFGDPKEAKLLFTHAIEISESSSILSKRQYALSTFDQLLKSSVSSSIAELVQPLFALNQLGSLAPSEISYEQLRSLFLERISNISESMALLTTICAKIEAEYEVTEAPLSLSRFALGKADLARSQLAAGSYAEAIESGETALELSAEDAGNDLSKDARQKCRLSAHLTIALAQYHNGSSAEAVGYIEAALSEAEGHPDAVCLLAQILWATGDDESRSRARDQLFDCVEKYQGHVQSVLLLGTIALLDGDMESLEAVISDLQALRMSKTISDEEQATVGEILLATAALSETNPDAAVLAEVQADIFMSPSQPYGWIRLAHCSGDDYSAEMALKTALKAAVPNGDLAAVDLAAAFSGTGKVGDAQRAIIFAPWSQNGWDALVGSISGSVMT